MILVWCICLCYAVVSPIVLGLCYRWGFLTNTNSLDTVIAPIFCYVVAFQSLEIHNYFKPQIASKSHLFTIFLLIGIFLVFGAIYADFGHICLLLLFFGWNILCKEVYLVLTLKSNDFNSQMQWETIVSTKLVCKTKKSKLWKMVYTSVVGIEFERSGDHCELGIWTEPIFGSEPIFGFINAVTCQNSVFFLCKTICFNNNNNDLNEEKFTVTLVEYNLSLSKKLNRVPIVFQRTKFFSSFDIEDLSLAHIFLNDNGKTAIAVFFMNHVWIFNVNSNCTQRVIYVNSLIVNILQPSYYTLTFNVWHGYLIITVKSSKHLENNKTTIFTVTYHSENVLNLNVLSGLTGFNIMSDNLAFFFAYEHAWFVTSIQQLFFNVFTTRKNNMNDLVKKNMIDFAKEKTMNKKKMVLGWTKFDNTCNHYNWKYLLTRWKQKHAPLTHSNIIYNTIGKNIINDNTASVIVQYKKDQRLLRMNQLISVTGFFLPQDLLFFLTEF
jgi:hypothetical protein